MGGRKHLVDGDDRKRAASDLTESFIVEAAAGTGKTTLLVERIVNLILARQAAPEEIVAITFTERAAAELAARLRANLSQALADAFETDDAERTASLAGALRALERMEVATIHSFCASLLRERPVEAGVDPNFAIADELLATMLKDETWDRWLARQMDGGDPALCEAVRAGVGPEGMKALALKMLDHREVLDALPGPGPCVSASPGADVAAHSTDEDSWIAALIAKLRDYLRAYQRTKTEKGVLDFDDLLIFARDMLRDHPEVREYFRSRYKYLLVDEFQDTDPLQAEIAFYLSETKPGEADDWRRVEIAPGRLFIVGDPKQSIYRFRRADIEMYDAVKQTLGKRRHLRICENFRCAPAIADVVNEAFSRIIARPADGAYQPDYVPLGVGRSPETALDAHRVVLLYPPRHLEDAIPSADRRRELEARAIAAFIGENVGAGRLSVWDDAERRHRPMKFRDIAVLMRKTTGLKILENALRSCRIDYRTVGGKHFFTCQEVEHIINVLRAIDNPHDAVALVGALKSPFFGASDEGIFMFRARKGHLNYLNDASGGGLEDAFGLLRRLHDMRNEVGADTLLSRLFEATKAPVVFLLKPGGDQRVANLLKISEIARALAARGTPTVKGLVAWLKGRQAFAPDESEAATMESGDDFVRLLTVHKAKGLEFPVVILYDLAAQETPTEKVQFIVDRATRRIAAKLGSGKRAIKTHDFDEMRSLERKRSDAEERRLLYVAMTRARDFLVLPVYWGTPRDIKSCLKPDSSRLLSYLLPSIPEPDCITPGVTAGGMHIYDTSRLCLEPEEPPPFRLVAGAELPEESRLSALVERRNAWLVQNQEVRELSRRGRPITSATEETPIEGVLPSGGTAATAEAMPPGRRSQDDAVILGKLVHKMLEVVDWSRPDSVDRITPYDIGVPEASESLAARAVEMVKRALGSDLVRRIVASDRYYKEVPFAFKDQGVIAEGTLDAIFEEAGEFTVVDFKTDRVSESDLKHRAEHYRPQAETYARAVQAALGKPPKELILLFLQTLETVNLRSGSQQ